MTMPLPRMRRKPAGHIQTGVQTVESIAVAPDLALHRLLRHLLQTSRLPIGCPFRVMGVHVDDERDHADIDRGELVLLAPALHLLDELVASPPVAVIRGHRLHKLPRPGLVGKPVQDRVWWSSVWQTVRRRYQTSCRRGCEA